ncbi:hypothetical protein [Desulfovibrio sp. Huiquan2017]|uniref:hypothetical protein n=1 Tax=Desulfovibrio sp. Huiquan2017 TaxID=2816861 RepID=UPI001A9265AD|nr:hypothetical protein [Desulfovibrio sp. Huiquan2017]
MWELIKDIGIPILTFGLGFLSKRYIDSKNLTTEHDIRVFHTLDAIADENAMRAIYGGARSSYHIGQARNNFYHYLSEAPKASNKFLFDIIENKKTQLLKATDELLSYYAIEGLPTRNDDQSIDPATMEGIFDRDRERVRFEQEVMPKSDILAEAFKAAFIDYRATVKKRLKV